jgi:hypothetical protein
LYETVSIRPGLESNDDFFQQSINLSVNIRKEE